MRILEEITKNLEMVDRQAYLRFESGTTRLLVSTAEPVSLWCDVNFLKIEILKLLEYLRYVRKRWAQENVDVWRYNGDAKSWPNYS